eukprot:6189424-Pleurochrysis_carterae.AAC.2
MPPQQPQFARSVQSTPPSERKQLIHVDAEAALERFVVHNASVEDMSGKEMFAIIDLMKREYGDRGAALEAQLLKVKRPFEKKMQLMAFVNDNVPGANKQATPLADVSNLAATAPADFLQRRQKPRQNPVSPTPSFASASTHNMSTCAAQALIAGLIGGRDHLSISGTELFSLVAWIKEQGDTDLEDQLMRVRLHADKKYHLANYVRKNAARLMGSFAEVPAPCVPHPTAPQHATAPQQVGGIPPSWDARYEAFEQAEEPAVQRAPRMPPAGAQMQQQVASLEQTLARCASELSSGSTYRRLTTRIIARDSQRLVSAGMMEDSYSFAVECWQADIKLVKEQLHALKSTVSSMSS